MEEDLKKLDDLFDSIIDEIIHPEKAGSFKNPFMEQKTNKIAELSEAVTVIMVRISDDSMAAYATVISKNETHKPFRADDILRVASSNGVFYGIDDAAVNEMAEKQIINTEVQIASGNEPVNGSDGRLALKVDIQEGQIRRTRIPAGVRMHALLQKRRGYRFRKSLPGSNDRR